MNLISVVSAICLSLVVCFVSQGAAGGDKSAKTTIITLSGGGDKHQSSNFIPIPIPVCTGGGGGGGAYMGSGGSGASMRRADYLGNYAPMAGQAAQQARMAWLRR